MRLRGRFEAIASFLSVVALVWFMCMFVWLGLAAYAITGTVYGVLGYFGLSIGFFYWRNKARKSHGTEAFDDRVPEDQRQQSQDYVIGLFSKQRSSEVKQSE